MKNRPIQHTFVGHSPEPLVLQNGVYVKMGEEIPLFMRQISAMLHGNSPDDYLSPPTPEGQSTDNVLLGKYGHYGISPVTTKNVNSEPFNNCLCVAAVGTDRFDEGMELGLLAHIVPGPGPLGETERLYADLVERLENLRELTQNATRSVLIAGGMLDVSGSEAFEQSRSDYLETVSDIREAAGMYETEVMLAQPSLGDHHRYLSLETQKRALWMRAKKAHLYPQPHMANLRSQVPAREAAKNIDDIIRCVRSVMHL